MHILNNRYEVHQLLGRGGMASVFAGIDRKHERRVAIKIFKDEVANGAFINDFVRGNRKISDISHPFLASIYDIGVDGQPFVVMEHIKGTALSSLTGTPLAWGFVVQLMLQICSGLACLHRRNLTHGDVKPSNVILTCRYSLKLIDFDLCALGSSDPDARMVGTLPWMAPEQITSGTRDPVSEIYSLGVILYELTTGSRPFGGSRDEVLDGIPHAKFAPPKEIVSSMPERIQAIILRAMAARELRYGSLNSLMLDLESSIKDGEHASWMRPNLIPVELGRGDTADNKAGKAKLDDNNPQSVTLSRLTTTTTGHGRIRRTALEDLQRLITSLFSRGEYRNFLLCTEEGDHLLTQVEDLPVFEDFVLHSIELLARRGLIDANFFGRLLDHRPRRAADVVRLAQALGLFTIPCGWPRAN